MGITNAPQGGGSSGGEWVQRTHSNNWTDLFEIRDDNRMYVLKDTFFVYSRNSDNMDICCYLPKGASHPYSSFHIPLNAGVNTDTNGIRITQYIEINSTNYLSGSSVTVVSTSIAYTTDGSAVTVAITERTDNLSKANIGIFTRD